MITSIVSFWKQHFLPVELAASFILAAIFCVWAVYWHGSTAINHVLAGNRAAVYGTTAAIFASLFGFVITALSLIFAFSGNSRLDTIRNKEAYQDLWATFTSSMRVLGLSTIVALFALIFDRDAIGSTLLATHPQNHLHHLTLGASILYVFVFSLVLSILRLCRCIWVLEKIITLATKPSQARSGE